MPDALYGGQKTVFVTEGVFDALSIIQCGGNAMALNSTENKRLLVDLLKKTNEGNDYFGTQQR